MSPRDNVLRCISSQFMRGNASHSAKLNGITSHEVLGVHISNPFSIVTNKD
jgi:hypothetical protein